MALGLNCEPDIVLSIFHAYPEAATQPDQAGVYPIEIALENKKYSGLVPEIVKLHK